MIRRALRLAVVAAILSVPIAVPPVRAEDCAQTNATAYQPTRVEGSAALIQAAQGQLGANYPALPLLLSGYPDYQRKNGSIACPIPQALSWIESGWRQARSTTQGATGPVLTGSGGCGVGFMQVSTGMRYAGELPRDQQLRIAGDYIYNVAYGLRLLGNKWNETPSIGTNDPELGESWYYAVWAYNAWSFKNNPNNPDFPSPRPTYDGSQPVRNYPYQELVFGLAANPPKVNGAPLWEPVPLSLPDSGAIGSSPDSIPAPVVTHRTSCALPTGFRVSPLAFGFIADPGRIAGSQLLALEGSGSWTVGSNAAWLSASPSSGSLPAQVTVSAATATLATGTYNAALDVRTGSSQLTVPVRTQVGNLSHAYVPASRQNR